METATHAETPIQTFYPGPLFDPLGLRKGLRPLPGVPPHGLPPGQTDLRDLHLEGSKWRFKVDPEVSFFGDCIRVVDEPDEAPLAAGFPAFGWSGAELLGGWALTASRLNGVIDIQFGRLQGGRTPFTVTQPSPLVGSDGVLAAPNGYELETLGNEVQFVSPQSRGLLDDATGRAYDFHLNCEFRNSAIRALLQQNPSLTPPPLLFPGLPHSGHALAWFSLSDDGRLRFHVAAQMFLPLGSGSEAAPLTMPASHSADSDGTPFLARNSSLHPYIFISATAEAPGSQQIIGTSRRSSHASDGPRARLEQQQNHVLRLVCLPTETYFGDDFELESADLGGGARAQSPLFGRLDIQLGRITGNFAPFTLKFGPPSSAYEPKFGTLLQLLPPGTRPGLVGLSGELAFPKYVYQQGNLSLNSDPYKPSVGVVDVTTGEIECAALRKYLFQDLMGLLLRTEPRTPSDSFAYLSGGAFAENGGTLMLNLHGSLFIPYPAGYKFPLPNGEAIIVEEGSRLYPFVNLVALDERAFTQRAEAAPVRFRGRKHVRGRRAEEVVLEIDSSRTHPDSVEVTLRLDDVAVVGRGELGREASFGRSRLVTGEFELLNDEHTVCTYYLTSRNGKKELQVVCSNEAWDLWFRDV
jgi:hypothetical protein